MRNCFIAYDPLQRLKPAAPEVWVVDGPETRMRYAGMRIPFTTRATVLRLADGRLFVLSPVAITPELRNEVAALGEVAWLVSPNRVHYEFLASWQATWPAARTAGIARERLRNDEKPDFAINLAAAGPFPWDAEIEHLVLPGAMVSEAVFFHLPSRTLLITDLIINLEPGRICCFWLRPLAAIGGVGDPDGGTARDLRLNFRWHGRALHAGVARMRDWAPERIILAHGRWYERAGGRELARALRWV